MESILQGLIVASISGLTFIAYKHPKAFKMFEYPLYFLLIVSFFVFFTYEISYLRGYWDGKNEEEIINSPIWHYLLFSLAGLYIRFLAAFDLIFENQKHDDPKEPQEDETKH
jgi:hypothetical protein